MDVEHFQRFCGGEETVLGSRRQAQEIARFQRVRAAVDQGGAAAGEDEVILFRDPMVANAGPLIWFDVHAPDRASSLLGGVDQCLDRINAQALHPRRIATGSMDYIQEKTPNVVNVTDTSPKRKRG
jgi:hypothetical protein